MSLKNKPFNYSIHFFIKNNMNFGRYIMKKIILLCSLIIVFLLTSCQIKSNVSIKSRDEFQDLLTYCEENAKKTTDADGSYYKLNWTDVDSSETGAVDFTVCIYESRKITITGKSTFPYNAGIENEAIYIVTFIYGSDTDTKINYKVDFTMKMTRLKDAYNYYPYTLDEVKMSDTKAVFDVEKWAASCYYEKFTSTNNLINFDDRNDTLRSVSVDSFTQLNDYLNDRANISLFGK